MKNLPWKPAFLNKWIATICSLENKGVWSYLQFTNTHITIMFTSGINNFIYYKFWFHYYSPAPVVPQCSGTGFWFPSFGSPLSPPVIPTLGSWMLGTPGATFAPIANIQGGSPSFPPVPGTLHNRAKKLLQIKIISRLELWRFGWRVDRD